MHGTKTSKVDDSFAETGLLRADGSIVEDKAGFLSACSSLTRLQLAEIATSNPAETSYELIEEGTGETTAVAVAFLDRARDWMIAAGFSDYPKNAVAVCRISPKGTEARLRHFGDAFGLPPAVIRTVVALYKHCDVKAAAAAAGISFNTAREYLTQARAAIFAPNLPRLITWVGIGALATDASGENDRAVDKMFSLSERQRRLAGLIADGASRADAAQALGISDAVAKKELAAVFAATGVQSAMRLARLFAELRGLAIIARDIAQTEPHPPPFSRNLIVRDGKGRRIVASDYGPSGGKPVIILHNTMNCRGVDRALVNALQNEGYRPISPDRPGYGDTDPAPPGMLGEDYLRLCTEDIGMLCDRMGWRKIPIIAHGPVHVVLALRRYRPDLVERAIIDAPEPDSGWGSKAQGMIPHLKRQFAKRPWAVASVVRIISSLASHDRIASFMRDWTATSPADRAAMQDPALMMDFYRKVIPFRQGRIDGFVREQVLQATASRPSPVADADDMTLLIGQTDFMHNADETLEYWRRVLPDARFVTLPDAGRFISYSHPDRLVRELL